MRKTFGLLFLTATLLTSFAFAQDVGSTETFVGIGATLEKLPDGSLQVDALIPNAPAEKIGMQIGDLILEVKSIPASSYVDVHGLSLNDAVALIRGPVGVPVELSVKRGNSEPMEVSIIREKFEANPGR